MAWPPGLFAQPASRIYRVGAFQFSRTPVLHDHMRAFRERMKQLGFVEGRNLEIAEEYSSFDPELRSRSASKLMSARPDVILAFGSTGTRLMQKAAGGRAPVVFTIVGDPVAYGIVNQLARPGRNTTGVASLQREMSAKRLELVRELLPKAKRIVMAAYLKDVTYLANEPLLREGAAQLGFELETADLSGPNPEPSLRKAVERAPEAIFVYQPMSFIVGVEIPERIAQFALTRRIPLFFAESELVARGGLLSYGPDFLDETRRAADLVARVLRGANAGDIPVDQSARFELVVNLKTAHALGIEIPQSVRPRIDRVIR